MMIKIGEAVSINVLGIVSVNIERHKEVKKPAGFFKAEEAELSWAVKMTYINHDNKEANYTVYGYDAQRARTVYLEVLNQVKEIENVGATQALEEAIRNG